MPEQSPEFLVPSTYSRIVARELGLQERDLPRLLQGTGLSKSILLPGDTTHIRAEQQMHLLENALHIAGNPAFGLGLGRSLQPASHGPMGYLVLSSPDVASALEAFAGFLPLRLPFSQVNISRDRVWLECTLVLKLAPVPEVERILHECFALMLQAVVESVLNRPVIEAEIGMAHSGPSYQHEYDKFFHVRVKHSQPRSVFRIPASLARVANSTGHSEFYAVTQALCLDLLDKIPKANISSRDQVHRLLLSSPMGSLTMDDVASAMFITRRTLSRRLAREGTSYRGITEKLCAELATRHLLTSDVTVEAVAIMLGYNDTAAFRKAFQRWYGMSPSEYRSMTPTQ